MEENKPSLDSLLKGKKLCIKCGSRVPFDKVGHKCELIKCPTKKK